MMALLRAVGKAVPHDGLVPQRRTISFPEAVRAVVRDLGRGEVASYGEVARRAGYPRAARAVGNVLASSIGLPWWRVIRSNGELAAESRQEQANRLRREGVTVRDGKVERRRIHKIRQ
jgi:methylated-DNA-protein-cysteine methyltransferase-like protein